MRSLSVLLIAVRAGEGAGESDAGSLRAEGLDAVKIVSGKMSRAKVA